MSSAGLPAASRRLRDERLESDPESLLCWGLAERAMALLALVATAPVVLAAGAAVYILSGASSPLIAHRRVGRGGASFWMWKLRTMWPSERAAGAGWLLERLTDDELPPAKSAHDPRVTSRFPSCKAC